MSVQSLSHMLYQRIFIATYQTWFDTLRVSVYDNSDDTLKRRMPQLNSRIPYNTTEDLQVCVAILASHEGVSMQKFALAAVEKWIKTGAWSGEANPNRPVGMAMQRGSVLPQVQRAAMKKDCSRSEIIHLCVEAEVLVRVRLWGCTIPKQFIQLMRSPNPLMLLRSA